MTGSVFLQLTMKPGFKRLDVSEYRKNKFDAFGGILTLISPTPQILPYGTMRLFNVCVANNISEG